MNPELTWLLAGLIPVALFIIGGWWILSRGYPEPVRRRSLLILALAVGVILLGVIGMAAWFTQPGGDIPSFPVEAVLAPALLAVCVIALVNLPGLAGARRNELILISLLGLAFIGLLFRLDDSLGGIGIPGSLLGRA